MITNYVDVSADFRIILSKSQSSNQTVIIDDVDISSGVSVILSKSQSSNQTEEIISYLSGHKSDPHNKSDPLKFHPFIWLRVLPSISSNLSQKP
jgi:hypothetical protein